MSYDNNKSVIYINNITYCGEKDSTRYEHITCTLFEKHDSNKKELSSCDKKYEITLDEFLKDTTFHVDNTSCKNYASDHLYLEIYATKPNGEKILYAMCPNCNTRIVQSEEGYICDSCGEKIEEPNYLMIIQATLKDETGTISATFFRKQAEDLIQITTDEVIEIFQQTGDESSMAGRIEDLIGHEVQIIANAEYNDYNEDIRLNVRRVVIVL
jgi:hypothetical protein